MTEPDAASPLRPDRLRLRDLALELPIATVLGALFPRLTHGLSFLPGRLGLRGRVAYTAAHALWLFVGSMWVVPYMRRKGEELERFKEDLRQQLGREPTDDEYVAYFTRARKG